ncbi:PREDICTED: scavenger receptor cysteine-rich domain superfamily protein-like [Amphimedon queenslandica]|uniref:SRCR domain-containing protein n=1 Tax=Amphimedon queenslandica TaxID=400682 RepID=A0A1X7U9U6_AMPQE|nr:PREDICTED: scavenger receptor cysteine-rich domain superfamily protein-like [Amphimedon queenslandica]|eukprot:XP_011405675.2 PREDICTED: scavenger receptor cysteine-rich domain superfamily protein-like [Amphimedon queenslandica]
MKAYLLFIALCLCIAVDKSASQACTYRQVRLYNGTSANNRTGMLQICNSQRRWTAVCDYRWKNSISVKVCRDLGHTNPRPITYINSGRSWGSLGYVVPSGSSSFTCSSRISLANCLSSTSVYLRRSYACLATRDTIVIDCNFDTSGCSGSEIRLYNSNATSPGGMVQMCRQGRWTAVCDFSWGCAESVVACRQLGYTNAKPKFTYNTAVDVNGSWTEFGYGPYSSCSSTATSLSQCSTWPSSFRRNPAYCEPTRDTIKLECLQPLNNTNDYCSTNYDVRLVNGTTKDEGRLEFCYRNKWTTFCGLTYISAKTAATLCNQLGYGGNSFATPIYDGRFGDGDTVEYSRRMYCQNEYDDIRYCSIFLSNSGNCIIGSSTLNCNYNRLGLRCYKPQNCNEGDVRLVNGTVEREGRLEVCANGVWGSVCSRSFAISAAYVACKQIGHTNVNGAVIDRYGLYGLGNGPIVYNNLACFGHETNINDCNKVIAPNFYCPITYVVGLRCLDMCKEGDVRLTNGSHSFEGTVEVCLDNTWCLVAQHGWDDADARVVCKQIGGYNSSAGVAKLNSTYGRPKRAIRYSNVYCNGNEEELIDCTHHTFEFDFGRTYDVPVAGVDCGVLSTPTVTSSSSSTSGITVSTPQGVSSGSNDTKGTVFISGTLFIVIGTCFLIVAIIIMVFVLLRMKKLSLKSNNTTDITTRMSSLPDDIKPSPSVVSYDEELLS